jgi:hypothetical protein
VRKFYHFGRKEIKMERDRNLIIGEVLRHSVRWWKNKNPYKTQKEHLENPEVNCITEADRNLAVAVSNFIRK